MGQQAALEVQKAEMEARIAKELEAAGAQRSNESSPSSSPTNAMDNAKTPEEQLRAAAAWGHDVMLRELLENSALNRDAADATNDYRWTAFHLACINGQAEAVELLVRAGCDTTLVIGGGIDRTGAQYAQHLGQQEVVDRLGQLVAEGCGGAGLAEQLAKLAAGKLAEAGGTSGGKGDRRTGVSAESTVVMMQGREQATDMATDDEPTKKSEEQLAAIRVAVDSNLLFANIEDEARREVFDRLVEKQFEADVDVMIQGEDGDFFYIVDRGTLEVLKDDKFVATLGAGDSFGELALMYSAPRSATVRTTTPTVCWALDRLTFRTILFGEHREQTEQIKDFLSAVPLLQPLSSKELARVVDAVTVRQFEGGQDIIVAGEPGLALFILRSGTAVAIRPPMLADHDGDSKSSATEQELCTYSTPGEFFGELALLKSAHAVSGLLVVPFVSLLSVSVLSFLLSLPSLIP